MPSESHAFVTTEVMYAHVSPSRSISALTQSAALVSAPALSSRSDRSRPPGTRPSRARSTFSGVRAITLAVIGSRPITTASRS